MENNMNELTTKPSGIRWLYLIVGSLTLLLCGILWGWSILKAPLAEEFGWNPTQLALNYTISLCGFGLGGLISGFLSKILSPRIRLFISVVLVFCGYFLTSRVNADGLSMLYVTYGIMAGLGIGIEYNTTLSVIGEWFPDKKGLTAGIMLMCFGFSTLIIGSIAGSLIANPAFGWRKTYVLLGVAIAVITFIFALIIKRPSSPIPVPAGGGSKAVSSATNYTAAEMVRTSRFWKLFLTMTLVSCVGTVTLSFAKDFALFAGVAETAAITLVGIASVCNGFGRIFAGVIYDHLHLYKTQWILAVCMVVAPICGILAAMTGAKLLGILTLLLCGFTLGLCPVTAALYPKIFFGEEHYPLNFSITNLTLIPTSFASTIAGAILTATGSYTLVYIMLLGCGAVGSAFLLWTRR